jgi:death on curing protein
MKLFVPTAEQIVKLNLLICQKQGSQHQLYSLDKIESSIHSATYPGSPPFVHGGVAKIAGALCFYLVQTHAFFDGNKRTAAITALTFVERNHLSLRFSVTPEVNDFARVVEECGFGLLTIDALKTWFENHKVTLEDRS